jgi:tRNA modification GTPase
MADDTIAAVSTAPGRAAIGIVRLSGPDLGPWIAGIVERPRSLAPRVAHRAHFLSASGEPLDDGIALWFPKPHSYTGDDVLELHGHGGTAVLSGVLQRCLELGARLAEPGEFTRRAFLNDKLDLAQAEAVADLIDAETTAAAQAALRSLSGEFSAEIAALVGELVDLRMFTEATLDFPEEDVEFIEAARGRERLGALRSRLDAILVRARQGQLLREGLTVALMGRPNVGKSSLLNRLAREDVSIVTPIPGTTRDALRQRIDIAGVALHIVDTAGIRETTEADAVERSGSERTWEAARKADCALIVVDETVGVTQEDRAIANRLPASVARIVVHNKIDLAGARSAVLHGMAGEAESAASHVYLSARTGEGVPLLESAILTVAGWRGEGAPQFIARERHIQALARAATHIERAGPHLAATPALELFAEELRLAQDALASITGACTSDDLLGEIFSRFCIGK